MKKDRVEITSCKRREGTALKGGEKVRGNGGKEDRRKR
jgi:hypothetical protein